MATPVVSNYPTNSPEKQAPDVDVLQGQVPPEGQANPNNYDPAALEPRPTYQVPEIARPVQETIPQPTTQPEAPAPTTESKPMETAKPETVAPKSGEAAMVNPEVGGQGSAATSQQVLSKIAGYQSTQAGIVASFVDDPNFPNNLLNFMQSGDPTSANLWQAILLLKWYKVLELVLKGQST